MQEQEKRELLILRELVAATAPSNLEAPGLDGSERSRKWHELREIQESIANKNDGWRLLRMACDKAEIRRQGEGETTPPSPCHELEHSGRE